MLLRTEKGFFGVSKEDGAHRIRLYRIVKNYHDFYHCAWVMNINSPIVALKRRLEGFFGVSQASVVHRLPADSGCV